MKINLPKLARLHVLIATLVLLLIPFGVYYVFFVLGQQDYFTDRKLRVLALMSSQISTKLDNVRTVFRNAVEKSYEEGKPTSFRESAEDDGVTLIPVNIPAKVERRKVERPEAATKKGEPSPPPKIDFSVKQEEGITWLYLSYSRNLLKNPSTVNGSAKSDLDDLLKPFVRRDEFDDVIIVKVDDGTVIYQRSESQPNESQRDESRINITTLNALVDDKGNKIDFNSIKQSSNLLDVRLAGGDYKLLTQPLKASSAIGEGEQGARWLVCGLISARHFQDETRAVSYTVLIAFVALLMVAVFSWPFMKLWWMGPRDRLRVADIYFLAVSALMGSALLTLILFYAYTYRDITEKFNTQLEEFANTVDGNLQRETAAVFKQLDALDAKLTNSQDYNSVMKGFAQQIKNSPVPAGTLKTSLEKRDILSQPDVMNVLDDKGDPLSENERSPYPFFDIAFWVDKNGQQQVKWTTNDSATRYVDLSSKDYFKSIAIGRGFELAGEKFWLGPVTSPNTGSNQALLTKRSGGDNALPVAAIFTRLMSLMQTVTPAGFGFIVINTDGKALFHSEAERHYGENLFDEADKDAKLRAAVWGRTADHIDTHYLGYGHHFYVKPIKNFPAWSLIVYRDKQIMRTAYMELLTVAWILFVVYALALLIFAFGYLLLIRADERTAWIWATDGRNGNYHLTAAAALLLCLAFGGTILVFQEWRLLLFAYAFPLLGSLLIYQSLRAGHKLGRTSDALKSFAEKRGLPFRVSYVLMSAALLVLVGVLPAAAFFKAAYNEEMRLVVKHGQVKLARDLEERRQRMEAQYPPPDKEGRSLLENRKYCEGLTGDDRVKCEKLRIDKAIRDEWLQKSWDVYGSTPAKSPSSGFFFDTQHETFIPEQSPKDKHTPPIEEATSGLLTSKNYEWFLGVVRPLYNRTSVELRGLTHASSDDESRQWNDLKGKLTLHVMEKREDKQEEQTGRGELVGSDQREVLHLYSSVPTFEMPGILTATGLRWWLGLATLIVVLWLLIRFVVTRVFLLNVDESPALGGEVLRAWKTPQNLFVVLPHPFIDRDKFLNAAELTSITLEDAVSHHVRDQNGGRLTIDGFDYKWDDPAWNRKKLELLEQLRDEKKTVIAISAIDPLNYSLKGAVGKDGQHSATTFSAQEVERWMNVTSRFWKLYFEDRGEPEEFRRALSSKEREILQEESNNSVQSHTSLFPQFRNGNGKVRELLKSCGKECEPRAYLQNMGRELLNRPDFRVFSPEHFINQLVEQADAYYRAIWDTCSKEEKLTLYHLAQDRLLGSTNPEIRRLMRRGLIVRNPDVRLMNESFRRFVLSAVDCGEVVKWEQEERSSWEKLQTPLLAVLLGIFVFLFVTQRDLYQSTLAFVTAAAAGIPAVFKLLGLLQKSRGGEAADSN